MPPPEQSELCSSEPYVLGLRYSALAILRFVMTQSTPPSVWVIPTSTGLRVRVVPLDDVFHVEIEVASPIQIVRSNAVRVSDGWMFPFPSGASESAIGVGLPNSAWTGSVWLHEARGVQQHSFSATRSRGACGFLGTDP